MGFLFDLIALIVSKEIRVTRFACRATWSRSDGFGSKPGRPSGSSWRSHRVGQHCGSTERKVDFAFPPARAGRLVLLSAGPFAVDFSPLIFCSPYGHQGEAAAVVVPPVEGSSYSRRPNSVITTVVTRSR